MKFLSDAILGHEAYTVQDFKSGVSPLQIVTHLAYLKARMESRSRLTLIKIIRLMLARYSEPERAIFLAITIRFGSKMNHLPNRDQV